jgi:transketolase
MDENRKKLLAIIDEFKLPLTEKEAIEHVNGLADEEVAELISLYEEVRNFQTDVSDIVKVLAPEDGKKIEDEYEEKVASLDDKHLSQKQEIQKNLDTQLRNLEQDAKTHIRNKTDELLEEVEETNKLREDLNDTIGTAIAKD